MPYDSSGDRRHLRCRRCSAWALASGRPPRFSASSTPSSFSHCPFLIRIVSCGVAENIPPSARGRPLMQRGLTFSEFIEWRAQSKTLSDAYAIIGVRSTAGADHTRSRGTLGRVMSTNAFALLRVPAMLGRTLDASDEANPNVVVLSHDTWQKHFNSDPRQSGTAIEFRAGGLMGGMAPRLMTIVGVLPRGSPFQRDGRTSIGR